MRTAVLVLAAFAVHLARPASRLRAAFGGLPPVAQGLAYAALTAVVFLSAPKGDRFIYFQF